MGIGDWRREDSRQLREGQLATAAVVVLTLVALGLRLWRLESVPPGWRDDELIESLVISQKVLDGEWAVYYPDASGHEALYHVLNAGMLAWFGPGVAGIRWLSVILGTLTVPLTVAVGSRMFGRLVGLAAAAMMAVSFWSLMYSRVGIRHISMPVLMLGTFYFFWRGLENRDWRIEIGDSRSISNLQSPISSFSLAGVFLGLGFYTYFAARGVPLILLAFCGYLWAFRRPVFRRCWRGFAAMFVVAGVLAVPLVITLRQQPEAEARVAELAMPLVAARAGNFEPLWEHTVRTLSMFHSDGDDEWLYNIPHRPVFGAVGAVFFWVGVVTAGYYAFGLLARARRPERRPAPTAEAAVFLLLWWLAGIAPGFLSVPAASLGHTIGAQPAVYLLAALPLQWLRRFAPANSFAGYGGRNVLKHVGLGALVALLLGTVAVRDLRDYFGVWPERGLVRFLYRGDIHDVAGYLNGRPEMNDFAITGLLAGPWDRVALAIDLEEERQAEARPRWYNPQRALMLEIGREAAMSFSGAPRLSEPPVYEGCYRPVAGVDVPGDYVLTEIGCPAGVGLLASGETEACFENGLCLGAAAYDEGSGRLDLTWRVERPLALPPMPLISNPPPPGVYAGPRLLVLAQLVDAEGKFLVGDDGLWVDPTTLYPGDVFVQQHQFALPVGSEPAAVVFGLYDPMNGERIETEDGRDSLRLEIGD